MGLVGNVVSIRRIRKIYKIVVGKPEGRRPLERPRRRCEANIRMGLRD
jgi:hypothetical protein